MRQQFPDAPLEWSQHATPEPSSKFEVFVNEVLCHSKVGDGGFLPAGFPDSEAKLKPIFAQISAALGGAQ